jgi:hypothetical protein
MLNFLRISVGVSGLAILAATFISGFLAYFIFSTDSAHVMHDGLGRVLTDSPWFMRFIFGQDRQWAGWGWFVGDFLIFWAGLLIGGGLATFGFGRDESSSTTNNLS